MVSTGFMFAPSDYCCFFIVMGAFDEKDLDTHKLRLKLIINVQSPERFINQRLTLG